MNIIKKTTSFLDTLGRVVLAGLGWLWTMTKQILGWLWRTFKLYLRTLTKGIKSAPFQRVLKQLTSWMLIILKIGWKITIATLDWIGTVVINIVGYIIKLLQKTRLGHTRFGKTLGKIWRKQNSGQGGRLDNRRNGGRSWASRKNRPVLWGAISVLIVLLPIAFLRLKTPKQTEATWWNDGWLYRKKIIINNQSSCTLTNVPYIAELDTAALITAGKLQSDGDDIRVTNNHGQIIRFQVEQSSLNTSETGIWFEADVQPDSSAIYYVYYGNSGISSIDFASDISSAGDGTTVTTNDGFTYTTSTSHGRISDIQKSGTNLGVNGTYRHTGSYPGNWWDDRAFTRTLMASGPLFAEVKMSDSDYGHYSSFGTVIHMFDNGFVHNRVYMTYNTSGSEQLYHYLHFDNDTRNSVWVNSSESLVNQSANSGSLNQSTLGHSWFGQLWTGTEHYGGNIIYETNSDWSSGNTSAQSSYYQTNYSYSESYTNGSSRNIRFCTFAGDGGISEMQEKASGYGAHTVSAAAEELSPGPVAHWKFDEGYGTTANDSANHGFSGTIQTSAWKDESMCISGKCLYFDGDDEAVYVGNNTLLHPDNFSISMWIKPDQYSTNTNVGYILADNYGSSEDWIFYLSNTGKLALRPHLGTDRKGDTTIPLNEWTHVVATYDGSTINLYVNGKYDGGGSSSGIVHSTSQFRIGGHNTGGWETSRFKGFIDEVKIFPKAKTAAQIKADYTGRGSSEGVSTSFGASQQQNFLSEGLVGYWKMDETSANTCTGGVNDSCDSSGNVSDGTWNGTAASAAGKFGNSVTLDGNSDYVDIPNYALGSDGDYSSFTLSAWVYANSKSNQVIFGTNQNSCDGLEYNGSNICIGASSNSTTWTGATPSYGEWHHVALVVDNSQTAELFIDSTSKGAQDISGYDQYWGTGNEVISFLGKNYCSGDCWLNGKIDEVRIYNRALSPTEVRRLYNWAPGPKAYYDFNEGSGTTLNDKSGNDYNSTSFTGSPTWSQGKFGKSLYFDGNDAISLPVGVLADKPKQITFTIWIKGKDQPTSSSIFAAHPSQKVNVHAPWSNSNMYWDYGEACCTGRINKLMPANFLNDNWNHFAFVADTVNNEMKIYANGTLWHSGSVSQAMTNAPTSFVLGAYTTSAHFYKGWIDEFKIYNYARTPGQIIQDMNAGYPIGGSPISSKISHWNFDEGYGTTVNDSGLSNNTGTFGASAAAPSWINTGKFNKALSFTAANNTVVRTPITDSNGLNIRGAITYSAWFKRNTTTGYQTLIDMLDSCSSDGDGFYLRFTDQTLYFRGIIDEVVGIDSFVLSYNNINLTGDTTNWHHIATTWDGTTNTNGVNMYIDGFRVAQTTANADATNMETLNGHNLSIGTLMCNTHSFDGFIDEVKIYNTALTPDEILIDMNQGASSVMGAIGTDASGNASFSSDRAYCPPGDTTADCAPVLEWKFDEKTGSTTYDTSGNDNTGTLYNMETSDWKSSAQCKHGGCVNIDETSSESVQAAHSAELNPATITVEGWFNLRNRSDRHIVITKWYGYSLEINSGGYPYFRLNGISPGDLVSTQAITWGQWHHIAASFDNVTKERIVYIDGKKIISDTPTGTINYQNNTFRVGYSGNYMDGMADDVRVYDYARTPRPSRL